MKKYSVLYTEVHDREHHPWIEKRIFVLAKDDFELRDKLRRMKKSSWDNGVSIVIDRIRVVF